MIPKFCGAIIYFVTANLFCHVFVSDEWPYRIVISMMLMMLHLPVGQWKD